MAELTIDQILQNINAASEAVAPITPGAPGLTTSVNFFLKKRFKQAGGADGQPTWDEARYHEELQKAQRVHRFFHRQQLQDRDRIRTAKNTHLGLVYLDANGRRITTAVEQGRRVRGIFNDGEGEDEEPERAYKRQYGRHADEELKRVVEIYVFCNGSITPVQVNDILGGLYENGAYGEARKWVKHLRSLAQHSTLAWFEIVLRNMLEYLGDGDLATGLTFWLSFPRAARSKYLIDKLEEAPEVILRRAFPMEANSVDFVKIWNHHVPSKTKKWRECVRTKFVNIAHKVIEKKINVLGATNLQQKKLKNDLFAFWKTHMRSEVFDQLELGIRIDEVPTLASRQETWGNLDFDLAEVDDGDMEAVLEE